MSWAGTSTSWFDADGYWAARLVTQRGIAAVYLVAFVSTALQWPALLGERGLLPAPRFLARVPFRHAPTLFHGHYSDRLATSLAWAGATVAALLVAGLPQLGPPWLPMLAFLMLWTVYLSFVNAGQVFYGFGWESLLLEAGFLAAFLGSSSTPPPALVLWLLRWTAFRLEFGAGLIKLRGDSCWRDLTCLYYHHETQPLPGPLSWYFHRLPRPLHKVEAVANHFAQLVAPFGLFLPQPIATIAAAIMVVTQAWLVLSGNFSWLNVLTMVIAFAAISDGALTLGHRLAVPSASSPLWWIALVTVVAAVLAVLSYWPVRNLISRHQLMNASFNPLHLVNAYGAFGTITRRRYEIVIEGSDAESPGPDDWREYEFRAKPGDPSRRPRQVAPYHLRLDWLMWFAALSPGAVAYQHPWLLALLRALLAGDRRITRLLARVPFPPDRPPRWVRARLYRYRFTDRAERRRTRAWWSRELVGGVVPPIARSESAAGRGFPRP